MSTEALDTDRPSTTIKHDVFLFAAVTHDNVNYTATDFDSKKIIGSNDEKIRSSCKLSVICRTFSSFDHEQLRYRTWCRRIHVWQAAKLVLGFELLVSGACLLDFLLSGLASNRFPAGFAAAGACFSAISVVATALYALGMYRKSERIMIPRFVAQTLNCLLFAAFAAYSLLIVVAAGEYRRDKSDGRVVYTVLAVSYLLAFTLQTYFIWILVLAYRYVRDVNVYRMSFSECKLAAGPDDYLAKLQQEKLETEQKLKNIEQEFIKKCQLYEEQVKIREAKLVELNLRLSSQEKLARVKNDDFDLSKIHSRLCTIS